MTTARPAAAGPAARLIALTGALMMPGVASAQFGGFEPPRPPVNVPGRPAPPAQTNLLPPGPPPARSTIQSEDLPPPSGTVAQPAALPRPDQAPALPPGLGQRQLRPTLTPGGPAIAPAAPVSPPAEDLATQPPPNRITNPTAVFSGLDKITGRITAFEARIGETVQFGALQVTARACYSRPPTETPLTDGFIEVDEVTLQGEVRRIFTGWMFAASPGLHGVEHAIYDVWLVDCKGGTPVVADAQPTAPAAPPPTTRPSPPQQRQATPQRPPPPPRPASQGTLLQPGPAR